MSSLLTMMTTIKRTIWKLRPKPYDGSCMSWTCLVVEDVKVVAVDEVWEKQKRALSDSTTWNQRSVGVQHSESPIPDGYNQIHKDCYIPFPIVNEHGHTIPAKYMAVFMAANLYTLGKLMADGPVHTREIHAAPCFDYKEPGSIQNLKELLPTWHQFVEVDTALSCIKDCSLTAEVHCYCHLMGQLGQLDEQMATIEKEMAKLIPQKHQCIDRLMKAQAVWLRGRKLDSTFIGCFPGRKNSPFSQTWGFELKRGVMLHLGHLLTSYDYSTRYVVLY